MRAWLREFQAQQDWEVSFAASFASAWMQRSIRSSLTFRCSILSNVAPIPGIDFMERIG